MKWRTACLTICIAVLGWSFLGCQPSKESLEPATLEGAWVEEHALADRKPAGRGGFYTWAFKGDQVTRYHTQTVDGKPVIASGHSGTYKLDDTSKPKAIDVILKSPQGEEWRYSGILELDGERLKLCLSKNNRPTTFEKEDGHLCYDLKRVHGE